MSHEGNCYCPNCDRSFDRVGTDKLDSLRAGGWSVAVHNDYRIGSAAFTFWLFTHGDGRWIKGEGPTDAEAIAIAYSAALYDIDRKAAR